MKTTLQSIALILFLLVLISTNSTFAQLTGGSVYTIDNTVSGSGNLFPNTNTFNSFATAITALNATSANSISTAVTFNVNAAETFTESPLTITYTNGNAAKPSIVFQRNGAGANPLILGTGGTGTNDSILTILGGDYYTFNGIDFKDNPANATASAKMEVGILLEGLATDGCRYNTFKNCTVTLDKANDNETFCVYTNNNSTNASGTNDHNTFTNNTLQNATHGYYLTGDFPAVSDEDNVINQVSPGRSYINDIGPNPTSSSVLYSTGIYISGQDSFKILNTCMDGSIYKNTGNAGQLTGIDVEINTYNGDINGDTIENFSIDPSSTGGADITGFYLDNGGSQVNSVINFNNNVLQNLSTSNLSGWVFPFQTAPVINRVTVTNVYNNLISNCSVNTSGSDELMGMLIIGGTFSIYGNTMSSFSAGSGGVIGINFNGGMTGEFGGAVDGNVMTGFISTGGTVTGVLQSWSFFFNTTSITFSRNNFNNFSATGAVTGLSLQGSTPYYFFANKIYNFSSSSSATGAAVTGVSFTSAPDGGNNLIYNNMVYDLRANSATTTAFYNSAGGNVLGFKLPNVLSAASGIFQFYFNTVYLNGVATSSSQTSSALFIRATVSADTAAYDIVDNILDNSYTGGNAVALWYNNLNNEYVGISTTSDHNLLYAGTSSAKHLLFYGKGADSLQTLTSYKTRLSPREQNSLSADPLFVSATGTIDVHITSNSPASQGGIAVGGITTDIDGDTRPGPVGTNPDIGADEITSSNNCTAAAGTISAARDTICSETSGNLTLTGNSVGDSIHWQSSTDNINFTTIPGENGTTLKTLPLSQSTYFRVIVGTGGCTATSVSYQLIVPPALVSNYTSSVSGNTVTYNSSGSSGNISRYSWAFGDGSNSSAANPSHTYAGLNKDSAYYACLTLYDGSNCSYTFCAYVEIKANGVLFLNGNDYFAVYPSPFSDYFTISSKQGSGKIEQVQVYDVLGRLALVKNLDNGGVSSLQIEGTALTANEIYYVKIKTTTAEYVTKVVKE